jgi:NhaA family Na+:H+ antiporter
LLQRIGVRAKYAYVLPALVAWAGIYAAGIHPTIAGVIVGLMTPVRAWLGPDGFVVGVRKELKHLESASPSSLSAHELAGSLHHVDRARREAMSPAESLIEALHPWVAFVIMPVFALANAGVVFKGAELSPASWQVGAAVAGGLVIGKPAGVLLACWLALKAGFARLPTGVTFRHLVVLGTVAGVGFTMALFIAQLAFVDLQLLATAKLGVILASITAGALAIVLGLLLLKTTAAPGSAATADEAEGSTHA